MSTVWFNFVLGIAHCRLDANEKAGPKAGFFRFRSGLSRQAAGCLVFLR
jgi:hypothetical protein